MISLLPRVLTLVALAILFSPALSDAHLMPEGQGSTRLVGTKAYTLISVPVGVLHGFDDDRNGLISVIEAQAHRANILEQIEQRVWLSNSRERGRTIYSDLQVPHFDSASMIQSRSIIQIRVSEWDAPPTALVLHADVFTRAIGELRFRTIIGDSTEVATLSRSHREHGFFGAQVGAKPQLLLPALTLAILVSLAIVLVLSARRRATLEPQTIANP